MQSFTFSNPLCKLSMEMHYDRSYSVLRYMSHKTHMHTHKHQLMANNYVSGFSQEMDLFRFFFSSLALCFGLHSANANTTYRQAILLCAAAHELTINSDRVFFSSSTQIRMKYIYLVLFVYGFSHQLWKAFSVETFLKFFSAASLRWAQLNNKIVCIHHLIGFVLSVYACSMHKMQTKRSNERKKNVQNEFVLRREKTSFNWTYTFDTWNEARAKCKKKSSKIIWRMKRGRKKMPMQSCRSTLDIASFWYLRQWSHHFDTFANERKLDLDCIEGIGDNEEPTSEWNETYRDREREAENPTIVQIAHYN